MRVIKAYLAARGEVHITSVNKGYTVVFYTKVRPGLFYHKEFHNLTFEQAVAKYNAIARIYMQDSRQKCGFYNKSQIHCACNKTDCPYSVINPKFWDMSSYDCFYRGR